MNTLFLADLAVVATRVWEVCSKDENGLAQLFQVVFISTFKLFVLDCLAFSSGKNCFQDWCDRMGDLLTPINCNGCRFMDGADSEQVDLATTLEDAMFVEKKIRPAHFRKSECRAPDRRTVGASVV
jgi:hypothetical protein